MRFLFWLGLVLVALVLASFTASNREMVALALWPLAEAAAMPVYLAVLGALLIGFALGALCVWAGGSSRRRESRLHRRRIAALERELAATQARLPEAEKPAALVPHG